MPSSATSLLHLIYYIIMGMCDLSDGLLSLKTVRIVDAYGHISVRNPDNQSTFFMSYDIAPALISSREDLVEYKVEDAEPLDTKAKQGYRERHIHSEVLKRFPSVNSVIHSHSADVLPYCINEVPLKPAIHMAGFLGSHPCTNRCLMTNKDVWGCR